MKDKSISPEIIATWVIEAASPNPERLRSVCERALKNQLIKLSNDQISDMAEEYIEGKLPSILINRHRSLVNKGNTVTFEIDSDLIIKQLNIDLIELQISLQKIKPLVFENLCSSILEKLGGKSEVIGGSNDGGIDFYATGLKNYSNDLPIPNSVSLSVFGQAKRHSDSNKITETDLRKFIGGVINKYDEYKRTNSLSIFAPVIFAFWTSSIFDNGARNYAEKVGIWSMDGFTLANYVKKFNMQDLISS